MEFYTCKGVIKTKTEINSYSINEYVRGLENQIYYLKDQIDKIKSETYKDSELQRLQQKIDNYKDVMKRSYVISESEMELINKFVEEHKDICKNDSSLSKEKHYIKEYVFSECGYYGYVVCNCGERYNFREID